MSLFPTPSKPVSVITLQPWFYTTTTPPPLRCLISSAFNSSACLKEDASPPISQWLWKGKKRSLSWGGLEGKEWCLGNSRSLMLQQKWLHRLRSALH